MPNELQLDGVTYAEIDGSGDRLLVSFDAADLGTLEDTSLSGATLANALDAATNDITDVGELTATAADTDTIQNQDYNETVETLSGSGTLTVDLETANLVRVEATGDVTIEFSNVTSSPPGNSVTIYLEDDDDTGPHTVTWPESVVWDGGDAIGEIPESSNVEASLLTDDGGTEWRGGISGEDFE